MLKCYVDSLDEDEARDGLSRVGQRGRVVREGGPVVYDVALWRT